MFFFFNDALKNVKKKRKKDRYKKSMPSVLSALFLDHFKNLALVKYTLEVRLSPGCLELLYLVMLVVL